MKKTLLYTAISIFAINAHHAQNFDWVTTIGGPIEEYVNDIKTDDQGNIYSVGEFYGTIDFDKGPGVYNLTSEGYNDIFVMKQDPNGNLLWAKSFGQFYSDHGNAVAVDANGNVFVGGDFQLTVDFDPGTPVLNLTSAGDYDYFISKFDANGNFLWAHSFGNTGSDYLKELMCDNSGNVYALGNFMSTIDFDPGTGVVNVTSMGSTDIFIHKLTGNGDYADVLRIGGSSSESANSFAFDASNNLFIAGQFDGSVIFNPGSNPQAISSTGDPNLFLLKVDTDLNYLWVKPFGLMSCTDMKFMNNALYLTGAFEGTKDFDPGNGVQNMTSNGYGDIFALKLTNNGAYTMSRSFGGPHTDYQSHIAVDTDDNIYLTGSFIGTVDFGAGTPNFSMTSSGTLYFDLFLGKYDSQFNPIWLTQIGNSDHEYAHGLLTQSDGSVVLCGNFKQTVDFDPASTTVNATSEGENDLFILKLNQSFSMVNSNENNLTIYPNPSSNQVKINTNQNIENIQILDMSGKIVLDHNNDKIIDLAFLPTGIYVIKISTAQGTMIEKIIKQ